MTEEKGLTRIIPITLFMIFISGCWTLATIIPFPMHWPTRSIQLTVVTVADVTFLLSLLTSILSYSGMADREAMRKWSIIMFCTGITALIASIILFSASYLVKPPQFID